MGNMSLSISGEGLLVDKLNSKCVSVPLKAALLRSMIALDDWLNTYADDQCDPKRVQEARDRISEFGTIGYIADVQEQNRKALAAADTKTAKEYICKCGVRVTPHLCNTGTDF